MDEDGADLGGVYRWVHHLTNATRAVITAEEGFAKTPAAGAGKHARLIHRFGDEVGLVYYELGVEPEGVAECTGDLGGRIIVGLQAAIVTRDEVRRTLEQNGNNRAAASRTLGIGRTTLWRLMKK